VGNFATSKGASQKQIVSKTIYIQHHIAVYHVYDFISNLKLDVEGSIIQYWLHQTLDPLDPSQLKQSKSELKQAKEKGRQLHKTRSDKTLYS